MFTLHIRMNLAYFEPFHAAMDPEASMRVWHCAIRNEWDFSSRKKWKNEFQIFESAWSDSSLSVAIVKRRTLRAVEHEENLRKPANYFWLEMKDIPKTAGSMSQQVKSNVLSARDRAVSQRTGAEFVTLTIICLTVDGEKDVTRISTTQQQKVRRFLRHK